MLLLNNNRLKVCSFFQAVKSLLALSALATCVACESQPLTQEEIEVREAAPPEPVIPPDVEIRNEIDMRLIRTPVKAPVRLNQTDYGREVELTTNNSQPAEPQKLIKVVESAHPVVVSVSGNAKGSFLATPPKFLLKGVFGSGGASHNFELDIFPGAVLTLPGSNVDADVIQDLTYAATAGGTYGRDLPQAGLVVAARATAVPGEPVYDSRAIRSYKFRQALQAGGAGVGWSWPIPPFAKNFMLRGFDSVSVYAATVEVRFQYAGIVNPNGTTAGTVETVEAWTGPQLQAVQLAGNQVPVPCFANTIFLQNSAATAATFFLEFEIGL